MKPTAADFRFWKAREPTPGWARALGASQPMLREDTTRALHAAINSHGSPTAWRYGKTQDRALDKANALVFCRTLRDRIATQGSALTDVGAHDLVRVASLGGYLVLAVNSSARYVIYRRWLRRLVRS